MKTKLDRFIRFALLAPFIVAMVIYGSTKPTPTPTGSISYPFTDIEQRYIFDTGSYVSNDVVHISFTYAIAPASADFELWRWPIGSTNEDEMVCEYVSTLGGVPQPYDFAFANAISNRWFGFTTWTPGPSVHTNGVALVNWQRPYASTATNIAAMTRTGIYIDSMRVAPNVVSLPYDAEVEYLESKGTKWIDTGIYHNYANVVRFKIRMPTHSPSSAYLGAYADYQNEQTRTTRIIRQSTSLSNVFIYHGAIAGQQGTRVDYVVGSDYIVEGYTTNRGGVLNGTSYTVSNTAAGVTGTSTATLKLLASNSSIPNARTARIYYFKIDNQCDIIPVRIGTGGCLYDRVSGRLLGIDDVDEFTCGPDK